MASLVYWHIGVVLVSLFNMSYQISQPLIVSLGSSDWDLQNENGSIKIKATVPGGIYSDLHRANILKGNVLSGDNHIRFRWVGGHNWFYSTQFSVSDDLFNKDYMYVTFDGLDTVSSILLNNVVIGSTNNMFVRYRFDIKQLVVRGVNQLEVRFQSPVVAAANASAEYHSHFNYSVPPSCTPSVQNGECHVNFLRKMQASFSWDWGPAFPSVGIWKAVTLEAFNSVIIRSVSIITTHKSQDWVISGTIYVDSAANKQIKANVRFNILMLPNEKPIFQQDIIFTNVTIGTDSSGQAKFDFTNINVDKDLVKMWWPNGYGEQNLYKIKLVIVDEGGEEATKTFTFGFRTVRLVQDPVVTKSGTKGLTFHFEINDVKIFAKGSNYIPSHILPELGADVRTITRLLDSAKYSNMNMLRVWGGGVYESELFYELCNEKGIMVWQDMMFACAMYPTSDEFLKSVSTEVVQNVRRLQRHPSIVVWAGNNENEAALSGNWYGTLLLRDLYKSDYVTLYVNTIRKLVLDNDNTRDYAVSSPSNGIESQKEGYVASNPYDSRYGDAHIYQYFSDNWDPLDISPTRFCSEYGIQSLPSYSTLLSACKARDLENINSTFLQQRQHHAAGYSEIAFEIDLNIPAFNKDSSIKQLIYFSQVNQAMSIKTMTEKYRSLRDVLTQDGNGLTMGALYWQLNDVWQAPSWASIEYGGKWKMLHYFAKDFFSPVLLYPVMLFDKITVKLIADRVPALSSDHLINVTLHSFVHRWDSLQPIKHFTFNSTVKQLSSETMFDAPSSHVIGSDTACGYSSYQIRHNCFMTFQVDAGDKVDVPDAFLFLERLTVVKLRNATIQVEIKQTSVRKHDYFLLNAVEAFELKVSTDAVALFVWLDVGRLNGHFSQNGFHMTSHEKTIILHLFEYATLTELKAVLNVMSVNGNYSRI